MFVVFPEIAHSATCTTEGTQSYEFVNFGTEDDCDLNSNGDCAANIYPNTDCSGTTIAEGDIFVAPYCEANASNGGVTATQCANTDREDINWSYTFASGRTGVFYCGMASVPTFTVANNNTAPTLDCTSRFISISKIQDGTEQTNSTPIGAGFLISVDPPIAANETAITVEISYGGTATSAVDYTAGPTNVSIAPGESNVFIGLPVIRDGLVEGTETITLEISNPSNGAINPSQSSATANLYDSATCFVEGAQSYSLHNLFDEEKDCDNNDCVISIYDTATCEGDTIAGANVFYPPYCELSIDYHSNGTSATQCENTQYEDINWSFTFDNNRTGVFFCGASSVPTFTVAANNTAPVLNCNTGYAPGKIRITADIGAAEDNALTPTVPGEFTVSVDPPIPANESAITVDISYGGTATNGVDYDGLASVTIDPGESSTTLFIDIIEDAVYEGTETVIAEIANASSGIIDTFQNSATINIIDDDLIAGSVSLTGLGQSIADGSTSTGVTNNTDCGTFVVNSGVGTCTFVITNNSGVAITLDPANPISIIETPIVSRGLYERLQHFSWWNLIGISEALAVGAGDFTVNLTGSPPYTINNGSSFTFTVNFTPTAVGLRDGILIVRFSDGSEFSFTISGNGTLATLQKNIPVFGPFGLLALLLGLLWFGNRRRST